MDFRLTAEQQEFRKTIEEFLQEEVTPEMVDEVDSLVGGYGPLAKSLLMKMGHRRWLAPSWPVKYGGLGLSYIYDFIVWEALAHFRMTNVLGGVGTAGPVLLRRGTEEQREEFLPPMARGEIDFAGGYTEPEAGTDLASLQLSAVEQGDCFVLNGQKTFSSRADVTRYHWVATRTDPNVPKHRGISLFIADLKSPGITISPVEVMDGRKPSQVFYDNVLVPRKNLVGEKNKGWYYSIEALNYERLMSYTVARYRPFFNDLLQFVKGADTYSVALRNNPLIRHKLAEIAIEMEVGQAVSYRAVWMVDRGETITYESSVVKVFVTEMARHLACIGTEILDLYSQLQPGCHLAPLKGFIEHLYRTSPQPLFAAGANEIQRDVIAVRGLGLPRLGSHT